MCVVCRKIMAGKRHCTLQYVAGKVSVAETGSAVCDGHRVSVHL